ncbi:MAG: hypothetical protein GTN65_15510, partial [Armatimonadetes bacterium]|nr:hypothetical protein [Armatimonadota bacterium]NIO98464.1 hypothetical protein [Armatimonadota bacterium]
MREEALALNKKGMDLFAAIQKGDEPFEKYQEAEAWIKEAGEKMDLAKGGKAALDQMAALTEGMGSLTAGTSEDEEQRETKAEPRWDSPLQ